MRHFELASLFREYQGVDTNFGHEFQFLRICEGSEDRWGSYCLHGKVRGRYFLCFFREEHPIMAPFVFFSEQPFLIDGRELVKPDAEVFVAAFNAWSGYYNMAVALGIIMHALLPKCETPPTVWLTSVQLPGKMFPRRVVPFCFGKQQKTRVLRRVPGNVKVPSAVSA